MQKTPSSKDKNNVDIFTCFIKKQSSIKRLFLCILFVLFVLFVFCFMYFYDFKINTSLRVLNYVDTLLYTPFNENTYVQDIVNFIFEFKFISDRLTLNKLMLSID